MTTMQETNKLAFGARLLAAAVFAMAALPGILDDRASTAPVARAGLPR